MTPPDEPPDLDAKPVLEWTAEEWQAWIETTRVPPRADDTPPSRVHSSPNR